MAKPQRKTFQTILRDEAPRIARELEVKARTFSRLAKIQPLHAATLYSLKNSAVRRLYSIPEQMPFIRDAWTTRRGFLLSIRLRRTGSLLHLPFEELTPSARQFYRAWVTARARGKRWQQVPRRSRGALAKAANANPCGGSR